MFVNKLDAASAQLETAIQLYFDGGHPISVHTLTAAAYNVIRDIGRKCGDYEMLIKDFVPQLIPGYSKKFREKCNEAENFFKHANRDTNQSIEFTPYLTELLLYDACEKLDSSYGRYKPLTILFRIWFVHNNRKLFKLTPIEVEAYSIFQDYSKHDRKRFRDDFLSVLGDITSGIPVSEILRKYR